ncbi:MAG: sigma-70 family RNA polymerase sigma factor, partial [Lachnospiraceae bacterium]|nr:sigma-70 family RNA polymerase sigma factor [Lachnospiraceae bacterium]
NIEARTGRAATDEEIARELGITDSEYDDWQSQMKVTNIISLDEFTESGGGDISESSTVSRYELPEEAIEKEELKLMLNEALTLLTDKERQVILMYYYEDLTLKEISNVLEVSESRVSQLHTKALGKMKVKMGKYMGILVNA